MWQTCQMVWRARSEAQCNRVQEWGSAMFDLIGIHVARLRTRFVDSFDAATSSPLIQILAMAVLSRLLLIILFILGRNFANLNEPHALRLYTSSNLKALLDSASAYSDFGWYSQIAELGYAQEPFSTAAQKNWAFFPLQPLLNQAMPNAWEQFLFGQGCFFAAMVLFVRACAVFLSRQQVFMASAILCFSPYSISISQFRPDSVLFFSLAATLYCAQRRHLLLTALSLLVAGFSKPNGFLAIILAIPHFCCPVLDWRYMATKNVRSYLLLSACAISGIVFMSILCQVYTGEAFAWAKIQVAWGNSLTRPLKQIAILIVVPQIIGRSGWDFDLFNWLVFAAAILSLRMLLQRHAYSLAVFSALYTGMTFISSGNWLLMKHLAASPAVFIGLGMIDLYRRYEMAMLVLLLSAMLCGVVAVASGAGIVAAYE